jgi:DNA helicase II / ATP-dependent DNA helicase PcrA
MAWNDDLTGVHFDIAASEARRIGVLAGPGTGKTTYGLLRRVARLIETGVSKPSEILLLTFTRTAANDLVEKLADLGTSGADSVRASTVHAFCFGALQIG